MISLRKLLVELQDDDPQISEAAAAKIIELGPEAGPIVEILMERLAKQVEIEHTREIIPLVKIYPLSTAPLVKALTKPYLYDLLIRLRQRVPYEMMLHGVQATKIRRYAEKVLSFISVPAIEPLIEAFPDANPIGRNYIIGTLAIIVHPSLRKHNWEFLHAFLSVKENPTRKAALVLDKLDLPTDPLIKIFHEAAYEDDTFTVNYAMNSFYWLGKVSIEPLISLLNDPAFLQRGRAAELLGDLRDERALQALEKIVISESDQALVEKARQALNEIKAGKV